MKLVRATDGALVADPLELADTFGRRLRGLIGRGRLGPAEGLWLAPCNSIHMMFVPFPIDVVFVAGDAGALGPGAAAEVVEVRPAVRPWLGLAWCRRASSAIELAAGRADSVGLRPGDGLRLEAA